MESNELTNGQKLVGINFNPGGREDVNTAKELSAKLINMINKKYEDFAANGTTANNELIHKEAVTRMVDAQMWIVKYLTWES